MFFILYFALKCCIIVLLFRYRNIRADLPKCRNYVKSGRRTCVAFRDAVFEKVIEDRDLFPFTAVLRAFLGIFERRFIVECFKTLKSSAPGGFYIF